MSSGRPTGFDRRGVGGGAAGPALDAAGAPAAAHPRPLLLPLAAVRQLAQSAAAAPLRPRLRALRLGADSLVAVPQSRAGPPCCVPCFGEAGEGGGGADLPGLTGPSLRGDAGSAASEARFAQRGGLPAASPVLKIEAAAPKVLQQKTGGGPAQLFPGIVAAVSESRNPRRGLLPARPAVEGA